jgi:signal transduction histidine kinase
MSPSEDDPSSVEESVGDEPLDTLFPRFVQQSLLRKVLFGLLVIGVLNVLIGGVFYIDVSNELDKQVDQQVASTTTAQTGLYDTWFEDHSQELESMASELTLAGGTRTLSDTLGEASADDAEVNQYHYVDADTGQILASSRNQAIGTSLFDRGVDPDLFTKEQFVTLDQYTTIDGQQAIALGRGEPSLVEDYLVAEYIPDEIGQAFEQPIEGTRTSLVSTAGGTLAGPPVETTVSFEEQADVSVRTAGDTITGTKSLQSVSGLAVVTQTPKADAYHLKNTVLQSFAVTVLLTFLMLVSVTLVGGRATMRDLDALTDRAKRMSDGDLDVGLSTTREDELGVLVRAFDRMRDQLQARIDEAEQSRERVRVALQEAKTAKGRAERAHIQAEEFNDQLQVTDRILRHNLHNALNVIMLDTQTIQREASGKAEIAADSIEDRIHELLDEIEKQRRITRTLSVDSTPVQIDVVTLIRDIVEGIDTEYPDAQIELTAPDTALVVAVGNIEHAFHELLENAVEHSDQPAPVVEIEISGADSTVTVSIADDGPGIRPVEQEVFQGNREIDPLHHGSGTGLWLVYWLVERSNGQLDFEDNEPRGNIVSIELQRSDRSA